MTMGTKSDERRALLACTAVMKLALTSTPTANPGTPRAGSCECSGSRLEQARRAAAWRSHEHDGQDERRGARARAAALRRAAWASRGERPCAVPWTWDAVV